MSRKPIIPVLCGVLCAILCAGLLAGPVLAATPESSPRVIHIASAASGPAHQRITLGLGKSVLVDLDTETHDVMVANPDIVDAVVRSPKRIFLLAAKSGQTNAFFFDAGGHQILSLDIRVEKDTTDLADMLQASLPNSAIKVSAMNDSVVLSGTVENAQQSNLAADLAASFAGDPKKVVNMLSIKGGEQVMLKVRISEMDRNIAKQFGVNLAGVKNIGGTPFAVAAQNPYGLLGHALSDVSGGQVGEVCTSGIIPLTPGSTCNFQNNVEGQLNALEQVGLVHMLAEPNLTAVSGETAKFLAGGEFPVPTSRDRDGNITLEFKPFGVGLSFTPVVLSSGRISIQLSSEVSQLTNTGAFTLQGTSTTTNGTTTTTQGATIPALQVRRTETTIELPSGGTFAVAGLMQHVSQQVVDGFPGLKDMPVLGALFRSRDFQNDETELVVMVSAYLVAPNTQNAFAAPTDGFVEPSDPETLLLGRLNAVYKKDGAAALKPQAAAPVGFVVR